MFLILAINSFGIQPNMCSAYFALCFLILITTNISIAESRNLIFTNNSISTVLVFGDSTVDSGNNNYLNTPFKSNFPPYGRDFANRVPTGRFTDGRLVTDFIASYIGMKEYVPPYLDPSLSLEELMTGVCFASAGSGFDPLTAQLSEVIPVQKQLEYFKLYRTKLETSIGKERTKNLIRNALFIISAGTNDFVINYLGTPFRRQTYNITTYQIFLLQHVQQFIEGLREEGASVIALVGLPPIGCIPIVITFTSGDAFRRRPCTDSLSSIALDYNEKLQIMLRSIQKPTSKIVYVDIYKPLTDMIQNPSPLGFNKVNAGCCGSGFLEATFLCNSRSPVCSDPSKYVFFDSVHPTEAAYKYIFNSLRPTVDWIIKNHAL